MYYGAEFSKTFQTFTGIRQGAASSAILFIAFIDGIIDYLKVNCAEEPLIGTLHCLLHADDTAILSTERTLFIKKVNLMLKFFKENALSMNLSKSGYLIINGKTTDYKNCLALDNGKLDYKAVVTYLGAKISDSGNIKADINLYINEKRSNMTIKYNNFCRKNFLAPLDTKLKVLDTCVKASLIYGCETSGGHITQDLESPLCRISING